MAAKKKKPLGETANIRKAVKREVLADEDLRQSLRMLGYRAIEEMAEVLSTGTPRLRIQLASSLLRPMMVGLAERNTEDEELVELRNSMNSMLSEMRGERETGPTDSPPDHQDQAWGPGPTDT